MNQRHKWADVIIAWANGFPIQLSVAGAPFRDFTGAQPNFEADDVEYRIKPRIIEIGDIEILIADIENNRDVILKELGIKN